MLAPEVGETGHGAHTKYRKIHEPTYDFRKTITYMYSVRNSVKQTFLLKKPYYLKPRFMCQDMPRMQDFAPFTPELLEALSGLQTPGHQD
jgi:hypothetical protein